jgi:hypothetical protein
MIIAKDGEEKPHPAPVSKAGGLRLDPERYSRVEDHPKDKTPVAAIATNLVAAPQGAVSRRKSSGGCS